MTTASSTRMQRLACLDLVCSPLAGSLNLSPLHPLGLRVLREDDDNDDDEGVNNRTANTRTVHTRHRACTEQPPEFSRQHCEAKMSTSPPSTRAPRATLEPVPCVMCIVVNGRWKRWQSSGSIGDSLTLVHGGDQPGRRPVEAVTVPEVLQPPRPGSVGVAVQLTDAETLGREIWQNSGMDLYSSPIRTK
ncbi:hypothetical protein CB1_001793009 [Camelus ferus]|nr:hypothetical protein CB1_001793009 [Camelus ferus]